MPELPEVETTKNILTPHLAGKTIESVAVLCAKLRWPVPKKLENLLPGATVQMVERRAKYIILYTNKGSLILHLGMSGSMRLSEKEKPRGAHDHFEIVIKNGPTIRLNDPRKFGSVLWTEERISQHKLFQKLGPEPLSADFSAQFLYKITRGKNTKIKQFVMDQKNVVGVGNIYASESLFLGQIHPETHAKNLTLELCKNLVAAIKKTLQKAIIAGGTSLKDFVAPSGEPGNFETELFVYARANKPCLACKNPVLSKIMGQRNTFFCQVCQKLS